VGSDQPAARREDDQVGAHAAARAGGHRPAKRTGTWDALAEAQHLVVPPDLQVLFDADEAAARNFHAFPPSSRRLILEWIMKAKRPETRERRIRQTVDRARINVRANY
jgi:uncharacterized protein YdeI (YjbR/CyaY-like superfamily)